MEACSSSGFEITPRSDEADVLVVNTCAFIDSAKEESIDAILEAHQERLTNRPNQKLIVSGCMSQRYRGELREQLPEVDAFIGLDQVRELGTIVERCRSGSAVQSYSTGKLRHAAPDVTFRITTRRVSGSRRRTAFI